MMELVSAPFRREEQAMLAIIKARWNADEVDGENGQVTRSAMLTTRGDGKRLGSSRCLCDRFDFATHRSSPRAVSYGVIAA